MFFQKPNDEAIPPTYYYLFYLAISRVSYCINFLIPENVLHGNHEIYFNKNEFIMRLLDQTVNCRTLPLKILVTLYHC